MKTKRFEGTDTAIDVIMSDGEYYLLTVAVNCYVFDRQHLRKLRDSIIDVLSSEEKKP